MDKGKGEGSYCSDCGVYGCRKECVAFILFFIWPWDE